MFAAAAALAGGGAAQDDASYCVIDPESRAETCDTCPGCAGFPGARTRGECEETCVARRGKRYAIELFARTRGSHAPVTFACDDALEQAEGEWCCFQRGVDSAGRARYDVYCFDAGQPLAKLQSRYKRDGAGAAGSGRAAHVPRVGGGAERWEFFEESWAVASDSTRYNAFSLNVTIREHTEHAAAQQ